MNLASAAWVRARVRVGLIWDRLSGTRTGCPASSSVYLGQYQSTITPPEIYYDGLDTGESWNLNSEAMPLRQSGSVKCKPIFIFSSVSKELIWYAV
jgi:hypothetical protein